MTGIELFKKPSTVAGEIADIVSQPCPPVTPIECEHISCRECWLAWLTTGEPAKEKEPSGKQTAPCSEGIPPNLEENFKNQKWLNKLFREVNDYVSETSPDRTSQ
ncbi:hypothetical protein SDC9_155187 [bioreactor metagenome]|uniref:Uncharacterized protein n=1 Tax=bioreactor metagenome TaxID=1076179 RepID=A0A645F0T9_9ZZZZ